MVGVQRPLQGKRSGVRTLSQHSPQAACESGVRWTPDSSLRAARARSKRCANARGPAIRYNKHLCSPRALHLPHLYQGALLPVGSIATAAGLSEPPRSHQDHLQGVRTPTPPNGDAGGVARGTPLNSGSPCHAAPGPVEPSSVLSPAQKVEHLFRIFDVDQDALLCYSELRAFLSALAEKEWNDRLRFEEWCTLLRADSSLGLTNQDFGKLLSLEQRFLDDAFRILGLESIGAKVLSPAAVLRIELLRRALDSNLALAPLLAASWRGDFQRLLASELLNGISGIACAGSVAASNRGISPAYTATPGSDSQDAFPMLLSAIHDVVEAAATATERWYSCFQGYLRRAALDRCVEEWAAFDATWGAKIATLIAQVRAVESLHQEVAGLADAPKPELVWRYARAVLELVPTMGLSKPNGLVMPTAQIATLESVARRALTGCSQPLQRNVDAGSQPLHSPPRTPNLPPRSPTVGGPSKQKRPFERPVRGWAGRPIKSAPATPVDRHAKPMSVSTPVDRSVKSVPATPVQQMAMRQDGNQYRVQPPTSSSGRSGKRPFATNKATAAPLGADEGELAEAEVQPDYAQAAAALDVEAEPESEAVDAVGVPSGDENADAAYDDEVYEDYDEEAEEEKRSSGGSSAILQQDMCPALQPHLSTSSHNDESRDVVEPLPAERCGSSARVGNSGSLRSGTPASNATYEMDFDSEDGNAAADVRSDAAGTGEEQERENPKDPGTASLTGSSDAVEDAEHLKENIAAEMQANAVLAAEMHGFSKDVQLARKPLGDDDGGDSDGEEDFFEDARRAARREEPKEAELAGNSLRLDEDLGEDASRAAQEEAEHSVQDVATGAISQLQTALNLTNAEETMLADDVVGADSECATSVLGENETCEAAGFVELEELQDIDAPASSKDDGVGEVVILAEASQAMLLDFKDAAAPAVIWINRSSAILMTRSFLDRLYAKSANSEHVDEGSAFFERAGEIYEYFELDPDMIECMRGPAENRPSQLQVLSFLGGALRTQLERLEQMLDSKEDASQKMLEELVANMKGITRQALDDREAHFQKQLLDLEKKVSQFQAAHENAMKQKTLQQDDDQAAVALSAFKERLRDLFSKSVVDGSLEDTVAARNLSQAVFGGVRQDLEFQESGVGLDSASMHGRELVDEASFLETAATSEELAIEKQATSQELRAEAKAAVATNGDNSSSTSTSSESEVECFTTEIPSRKESPEFAGAHGAKVQHRYLVDNSEMCTDAQGISYRSAKDVQARLEPEDVAPWNSYIQGCDEGGDWVWVPAKSAFLPSVINGIRVLRNCDEAGEQRRGSWHSDVDGSSVWELDIDNNLQLEDPNLGLHLSFGADGSNSRYEKSYEAGEVCSLAPSNRCSNFSGVAETISLPESNGSVAEPDSYSMVESRNASDEFSAELLSQASP